MRSGGSSLLCRSLRWHYPDSGSTGLISAAVTGSTPGERGNIGRAEASGKPREVVGQSEFLLCTRSGHWRWMRSQPIFGDSK